MTATDKDKEKYLYLSPGCPGSWFSQRTQSKDRFAFDTAAGRYLVLCFFGSAGDDVGRDALAAAMKGSDVFNDAHASFFGVSIDHADLSQDRIKDQPAGIRFFLDFDGRTSRLYGALPEGEGAFDPRTFRRFTIVLDPTMRVLQVFPLTATAQVIAYLRQLPPPGKFSGIQLQAPVLYLPNVFEPGFCQHLTALYDAAGGKTSGVMREIDGKTVLVEDSSFKVRRDHHIEDPALRQQTQIRIKRAVVPEIQKIHQFEVTRMERYIVACYAAEDKAHFSPHRDNTTKGTAHRRFALSINLNSDFEGGEVYFPEYGTQTFKPPPGGAVVFSCSMLHAVTPVTRGKRYAFLPFLYDDAAAKIREANNVHLDDNVGKYAGSGLPS